VAVPLAANARYGQVCSVVLHTREHVGGMASQALWAKTAPVATETWTPSRRLQSAALADRRRLEREQQRVDQRVALLKDQLAELEAVQTDLAKRRKMLDLLASDAAQAFVELHTERAGSGAETIAIGDVHVCAEAQLRRSPGSNRLRGSGIRQAAVRVLAQSERAHDALHYREWYQLFVDAGFSIVGKDAEASFLTQLSRSPVVRRSTQAGIYELDFDFIERARDQLRRLRERLRATHDPPHAFTAEELQAARAQRTALHEEIGAVERQLQEALETLGDVSATSER
jgi:hypothetical protein